MERSPYEKPQGEDVQGAARRAAEQAKEKAQQLGHRAAEQIKSGAHTAKERAESMADEGRSRLAGRIEGVARALRRTSTAMHDEQDDEWSMVADRLGNRVEELSHWLREHDTRDVVGRVENFARSQPALFLGGAFAIGIAAARFLKSSSHREDEYDFDYELEPEGSAGYYGEYEKVVGQPTISVTGGYSAPQQGTQTGSPGVSSPGISESGSSQSGSTQSGGTPGGVGSSEPQRWRP